jgi:hypothetical protein
MHNVITVECVCLRLTPFFMRSLKINHVSIGHMRLFLNSVGENFVRGLNVVHYWL